jgi:hypothetical protein
MGKFNVMRKDIASTFVRSAGVLKYLTPSYEYIAALPSEAADA